MCADFIYTKTEQKELGSIVKLAIAKMHKPLVFKCFRSLKKLFTNHCFGCRLNLTILADLRHSKQQLCWPHCYSSSVLMVIRVTMFPGVVTILTAVSQCHTLAYLVTWGISQANYWTHTKWSQWGNIQTRQNIWSTPLWLQQYEAENSRETRTSPIKTFVFSTDNDRVLSSLFGVVWEDRAH